MAENQIQTVLTPAQQNITNFKKMVDGNYVQAQLKQVLKENAGTFATSLMEVYTNDKQLQACEPKLVIQEAIKAASLKLPLNKQLGYGYILVFNNWDKNLRKAVPTPTFVPGYRGFIQLAMRTGQYKNINADVVFEGELKGKDKLSGAIDLSGEKTSDKVVGYFAHFELLNGFAKTWYMSIEQMATFALTYAPVFKGMKEKPTIDNLIDLANEQIKNGPVQGQTGWKANFNAMAQKTVLRNLLSKYGFLSIEMMNAISMDEKQDYDSAEEIRDTENAEQHQVVDVNKVIEDAEEVTEEQSPI